MFYDDHHPPHFHAKYAEHKASVRIADLAVLEGYLPPRVMGLVAEWASLHRQELMRDWELAANGQPLTPIQPLE
ncbi:MAG: DUF4160 domain-containing protein [Elusimicrobia bacterium]|nr:DUF4160 domain-containing protein [Elusimicrobiota bacterium]